MTASLKYILLIGYIAILSNPIDTQGTPTIDSLKSLLINEQFADSIAQLISKTSSDSLRTSHYYDAAQYALMQLGDLKLTRKYNDSTMFYAITSGHKRLEAQCHFAFGLLERVEGNYNKALDHLQKNIEYFKDDSLMMPYAMFQVGVVYRQTGKLEKGLQTYLDILKIFEHRNDTMATASTLNSIANLYGEMGKFDESIQHFKQAKSLFIAKNNKRDISNTEKSLALMYIEQDDLANALKSAQNALAIAREINYTQLIGSGLHTLGLIHFKTDQQKGLEYLFEAKEFLDQTEFTKEKIALDKDLGLAYYQLKKYPEARSLLLMSLDNAETKNIPSEIKEISEALSEIYAEERNYSKAYAYRLKYEAANDTLFNIENVKSINALQEQYESELKDKELVEQQLQIQESTYQRNLAYAGGIGLIALGGFFFYRNRKNQKLANSKIDNLEKQQKLMALDYMVQGQEEERKRIAQDLHDGLGGLLSSVRHQIRSIQEQIASLSKVDIAGDAEQLINKACDEVRRISHDMMPASLVSFGLVDAVEDLVADIKQHNQLEVIFTSEGNFENITDKAKVNLYRIIQEIINNTIKHADANRLYVSIVEKDHTIKLEISDDGKGFDYETAKQKDGIGLRSIESRVKYLEGKLEVKGDEKGTSYFINVPV
jgi:signal transduction histidine kinase